MKTGVDKLIEEYSKDSEFKEMFENESKKLEIAVTMKMLREEMKLTQREFSLKIGKPQSTIARIENGNLNPTLKLLQEIADSLGKKMTITFN